MSMHSHWKPYVSVAQRKQQAAREVAKLKKQGVMIQPVTIAGRTIASSFWGKGWCEHMESFHDYENRLPRGRTYVRNGSVCHLEIKPGLITAMVSGSELYNVTIKIAPLAPAKWTALKRACAGKIGSLLDLLRGRFADAIMEVVCHRQQGLFPQPGEIKFDCDCPDWASMCKHVAAVLYGVGARLDQAPEQLFLLRGVDHQELVSVPETIELATSGTGSSRRLGENELGDVFGIDLATETPALSPAVSVAKSAAPARKPARKAPGAAVAKTTPPNIEPSARGPKKRELPAVLRKAIERNKARLAADMEDTNEAQNRASRPPAPASRAAAPAKKRAVAKVAVPTPPAPPFPKTLTGNTILRWRNSLDETQATFARRLGVSAGCISHWELKGRQKISPQENILAALHQAWQETGGKK